MRKDEIGDKPNLLIVYPIVAWVAFRDFFPFNEFTTVISPITFIVINSKTAHTPPKARSMSI